VKIVTWTSDCVPDDLEMDEDGDYWMFEDHKFWHNLQIGDQIQYLSYTGDGTKCYFVIDVFLLDELNSDRTLVTVEAV
jgi:hypothetical protein